MAADPAPEYVLELDNVSKFFGTVIALARANEDQSRTLAELRDLLLSKLLSGELRIREADKAVEVVL